MAKTRPALGRGLNALIPTNYNNSSSTATTFSPNFADPEDEIETAAVSLTPKSEHLNGKANQETSSEPTAEPEKIGPKKSEQREQRKVGLSWVEITSIAPNPYQPRKHIDPEILNELADSIKELGIIQPPVVSYNPDFDEKYLAELDSDEASKSEIVDEDGKNRRARYLLIAGERRWQASKLAGLTTIPVVLKESTPLQMLEMALVENIQRADLNPIEEATAYRQLVTEFKLTQQDVARRVGKSRAAVANALRLLDMPKALFEQLSQGNITEGHARALLMVHNVGYQHRLLTEIIEKNLSVRQAEETARRYNALASTKEALAAIEAENKARIADRETSDLEDNLRRALGTKVELVRSKNGGKITIQYSSDEILDSVYRRIVGDNEI